MNLVESRRKPDSGANDIIPQILDEHNLVQKKMPAVLSRKSLIITSSP